MQGEREKEKFRVISTEKMRPLAALLLAAAAAVTVTTVGVAEAGHIRGNGIDVDDEAKGFVPLKGSKEERGLAGELAALASRTGM